MKDRKQADIIFILSADPYNGGYIIASGGQTGTVENGHIDEDRVPNYNRQAPVRYVFLTVLDPKTGDTLWSDSHHWGGLLTGFNTPGGTANQKAGKSNQEIDRFADDWSPVANFTSEDMISADARFLYAANRLHDSIAWFAIGEGGILTFVGEEWTRGDYPRSSDIDPTGNYLYSCNQRAAGITSYRVNRETGALSFVGQYAAVGTPRVIVFLA